MDKINLEALLEALLFINGEPVSIKKIAALLAMSEGAVITAAAALQNNLAADHRGLTLINHNQSLQLVTKPNFSQLNQKVLEDEFQDELTPAATEVVAILAYGGSLSRAEIEYIRGVNSFYILRNLALRGLIEKQGGHYAVSFDLLKRLGLASLSDLPDHQRYQELIHKFKEGHAT